VLVAAIAATWYYYDLAWQFLFHVAAGILTLIGLFNPRGLGQFRWLTGLCLLATIAGVFLVPSYPEWAFLVITGIIPFLIALLYVFTRTTNHQLLTSALAVGGLLLMIFYALLATLGVDPTVAFLGALVAACISVISVRELRERTGVTAPGAVRASTGLYWLIGVVAVSLLIIAYSKVYGTGWTASVPTVLKWGLTTLGLILILGLVWSSKRIGTPLKVAVTIVAALLIFRNVFLWIGQTFLAMLGSIHAFVTSHWLIAGVVLIVFIVLGIALARHMKIWSIVGAIFMILVFWFIFGSVFDGTRSVRYPVLDTPSGVPIYEDKGPGTDPNTMWVCSYREKGGDYFSVLFLYLDIWLSWTRFVRLWRKQYLRRWYDLAVYVMMYIYVVTNSSRENLFFSVLYIAKEFWAQTYVWCDLDRLLFAF
jgi:hypothetical protein